MLLGASCSQKKSHNSGRSTRTRGQLLLSNLVITTASLPYNDSNKIEKLTAMFQLNQMRRIRVILKFLTKTFFFRSLPLC